MQRFQEIAIMDSNKIPIMDVSEAALHQEQLLQHREIRDIHNQDNNRTIHVLMIPAVSDLQEVIQEDSDPETVAE